MTVGAAPPPTTTVAPGAMWYNTNTGRTFILYDDGDSRQWVENVPAVGSFDSSTVAGYANAAVLPAVTPAYNTANAAFAKANTALQNTSGTFAGSLTATGDVTSGGTLQALSTVQSSSGADLSLNANGANRDVIVKVNSSELARVVGSTGRVGIGTSTPSAKLHVSTGATGGMAYFQGSARTIYFEDDGSGSRISTEGTGQFSIRSASSGGNHLTVDASGRVMTPYQPMFYAYHNSSGQASSRYGYFSNVYVNQGGHATHGQFDQAYTHTRFTCPVAGKYMVWVGNIGNASASTLRTYVHKNGSIASAELRTAQTGNHGTSASMMTIINAAANDYIGCYSYMDDASSGFYAGVYSHMGVMLIG